MNDENFKIEILCGYTLTPFIEIIEVDGISYSITNSGIGLKIKDFVDFFYSINGNLLLSAFSESDDDYKSYYLHKGNLKFIIEKLTEIHDKMTD